MNSILAISYYLFVLIHYDHAKKRPHAVGRCAHIYGAAGTGSRSSGTKCAEAKRAADPLSQRWSWFKPRS